MGATYFDYLIADSILIPEESKGFYTEKIVYLPSYQCNDNKFSISDENFTRREFSYSSFSRSFTLPKSSNHDKIDAKYCDGILKLSIPKNEHSKLLPKKEIKVG